MARRMESSHHLSQKFYVIVDQYNATHDLGAFKIHAAEHEANRQIPEHQTHRKNSDMSKLCSLIVNVTSLHLGINAVIRSGSLRSVYFTT
jgi:hypothetical protein